MNDRDKVRTQDLCFDTMLNRHLSRKLKLIMNDKFNHLINIITLVNLFSFWFVRGKIPLFMVCVHGRKNYTRQFSSVFYDCSLL
jgi:hypothetical protein